ncbi:MAG TPA: hypothetical protein V6D19_05760 [Stenomitos sp.]
MGRGRPGGNPDLEKHKFVPAGEESLSINLQVRITASMNQQLKQMPKWQEFVRTAIAEKLARETP